MSTKWLLRAGDGNLYPREAFFLPSLPGYPGCFRTGHPSFLPPPPPTEPKPHIPHADPYRNPNGTLKAGHPDLYPAPRRRYRLYPPPPRDQFGQFRPRDPNAAPPTQCRRPAPTTPQPRDPVTHRYISRKATPK